MVVTAPSAPTRIEDLRSTPAEIREVRPFLADLPAGRFALVFLGLSLVALLPVVWLETPSIVDYPNHLARVQVLREPEPFRDWYVTRWGALPNLAFDAIVGALSAAMPLEAAGKVFLALTLLQLALGAVLLHKHFFGEWALWPCLSFALLYSRILLSGVVGYLFGIGLCLLATAAWLHARSRPPWQRLILGTVLCAILFFAHFMALAVYGIIVFSAELALVTATPSAERRRALAGLAATVLTGVPPLIALAFLAPAGGGPARIAFRSLWSRVEALGTPFVVYTPLLDVAFVVILLALAYRGARTRMFTVPREIGFALIALIVVHLLMPNVILTLEGADRRLPIAAMFLLLGGTRIRVRPSRAAKATALALLVLFVARLAGVFEHWRSDQAAYRDAKAAMAPVERGSRVLTAFREDALDTVVQRSFAVYYIPVWETVRRAGFAPGLFAYVTQQPVHMTPEARRLADGIAPHAMWNAGVGAEGRALGAQEQAVLANYDYVAFVDNRPFAVDRPAGLDLVIDRPCAKLFRVRR